MRNKYFGSLFAESEALQPYRPEFHYELRDISRHSREEIRGEVALRLFFLLLKHILWEDQLVFLKTI